MVYTMDMLLDKYKDYSNAINKISRDVRDNKLFKLKRGLYEDDKNVKSYLLSGYIYGPSYVSFEYILSLHGLIPEYVPNITCATFGKNKSKVYHNIFATYVYHDIPKDVFSIDVNYMFEDNYSYLIATPEKALCDKLYTIKQVYSKSNFKALMFDDLRIDMENLKKLNYETLKRLAPLYKRNNLDYLLKLWGDI